MHGNYDCTMWKRPHLAWEEYVRSGAHRIFHPYLYHFLTLKKIWMEHDIRLSTVGSTCLLHYYSLQLSLCANILQLKKWQYYSIAWIIPTTFNCLWNIIQIPRCIALSDVELANGSGCCCTKTYLSPSWQQCLVSAWIPVWF